MVLPFLGKEDIRRLLEEETPRLMEQPEQCWAVPPSSITFATMNAGEWLAIQSQLVECLAALREAAANGDAFEAALVCDDVLHLSLALHKESTSWLVGERERLAAQRREGD